MSLVVIYNCKRCKVGRRVEYAVHRPRLSGSAWFREEGGKLVPPGVWIESCGGGRPPVYGGDPLGRCPSCGRKMVYGALMARVSANVPCDARCTGARGHTCDCSCGGKNHGAGWAAA